MAGTNFVIALEERRRQALLSSDLNTLQSLLSDNLIYMHSTGVCDHKDSYLAKLANGSLKYLKLNFGEMQVQELKNAAVVTGRMSATISKDGQQKEVASLFMTVWACGTDGAWRLHAHQGTPVPTA